MSSHSLVCSENHRRIFLLTFMLSISLICAKSGIDDERSTIIAIAVLFRHGDRSPALLYPNDPYLNCSWFGGLGALSEIGALMHYNNGKRLRSRYGQIVRQDELYTNKKFYILSSSVERCLMSAQSFMSGFLPPPKNNSPLPLNWQPAPINTMPTNMDPILAMEKPCPRYGGSVYSAFLFNNSHIEDFNNNKKLLAYLTEKVGQNITSIWDTFFLWDVFKVQKDAHLKIPEWAEKYQNLVLDHLGPLAYERFSQAYVIKYIRGGALLYDMMRRLNDFVLKKSTVNVNIYSGHDITVAALLSVLEITNQTTLVPEYASTVVIEVHENKQFIKDYEVKLKYLPSVFKEEVIDASIPGCQAPCSFRKFMKLVGPRFITDFDTACRRDDSELYFKFNL